MKKLISVILCLCLLCQVLPMGVLAYTNTEADLCGDDVWWTLENGHLRIFGTGPMYNWAGFRYDETPWYHEVDNITRVTIEEGVTEIGSGAFCDISSVEEVTIPESVTRIGSAAFQGCTGLVSMRIPAAVTSIEHDAFTGCTAMQGYTVAEENTAFKAIRGCLYTADGTTLRNYPLAGSATSFTIPDGTTTVGSFAFAEAVNLTEIIFNEQLVYIDDYAFTNIEGLSTVELPDSLKGTGGRIFSYCTNLERISLPATMEHIGPCAFCDTAYYYNKDNWDDGVLYLDNYLLCGRYVVAPSASQPDWIIENKSGTINIRQNTTLIADEAFFLTYVDAVNFNSGLLYIGDAAFYGLDITQVNIPSTVKSIGDRAFYECALLGQISMGSNLEYIGADAFQGTAYDNADNYVGGLLYYQNYLLDFNDDLPYDVIVKEGTTLIAAEAFWVEDGRTDTSDYGADIDTVTFPASLTTIGDGAFLSCDTLREVEIPSTVTTIGEKAFGWHKWYSRDLEEEMYDKLTDFTIQCAEGSAAETYAIENGIDYERPPIRATSLQITQIGNDSLFAYSASIGGTYELIATFAPADCVAEKVVSWSSDNEAVAIASRYNNTTGRLTLQGIGTATITATSESGLTDTFLVTVVNPPYITVGNPMNFDCNSGDYYQCLFTPTESDYYTFTFSQSNTRLKIQPSGSSRTLDSGYGDCGADLEAGSTYKISIEYPSYLAAATHTLTVTKGHGGTGGGNADIGGGTVTPTITGIEIQSLPEKYYYDKGEPFDISGMVVIAVFSDGSIEQLSFGNCYIEGFDCDTPGEQTLTVRYMDFSETFTVVVTDTPYHDPDASVPQLYIAQLPNKVTYYEGEALDTTGMIVRVTWPDGSDHVAHGWTVGGYDPSYIGTQTLTVSWEGLTTELMVDVYANPNMEEVYTTGITVRSPVRTTYEVGEKLDTMGFAVFVHYSNGESEVGYGYQLSGYDMSKAGRQTVTVTWGPYTGYFDITVMAPTRQLTSISISKKPDKVTYILGDTLSLKGLQLRLNFSDGAFAETKNGFNATANLTKIGKRTVTVNYAGKSVTYTVTVKSLGTPKPKAVITTKGIKVSWSKISGADKYIVQRRLGSGKWSTVKTVTSTSYTDTKASYGKSYTYRVKAVNGRAETISKATASLRRLKAPASIKLSKAKKGFKVTWKKVSGAKQYELYRKEGSGKWKKVKATSSVSYTDKTAKMGKFYTYRVRAVYGSSDSEFKTGKKTKR